MNTRCQKKKDSWILKIYFGGEETIYVWHQNEIQSRTMPEYSRKKKNINNIMIMISNKLIKLIIKLIKLNNKKTKGYRIYKSVILVAPEGRVWFFLCSLSSIFPILSVPFFWKFRRGGFSNGVVRWGTSRKPCRRREDLQDEVCSVPHRRQRCRPQTRYLSYSFLFFRSALTLLLFCTLTSQSLSSILWFVCFGCWTSCSC